MNWYEPVKKNKPKRLSVINAKKVKLQSSDEKQVLSSLIYSLDIKEISQRADSITEFKNNGLNKEKLFLTIRNLKSSNEAISFYVKKNIIYFFIQVLL